MKTLNKITLAAALTIGLFAGASLNVQADSLSSKDTVLRTVIATPAKAKVSGQAIDAGAYSSKESKATVATPAKARVSGSAIDATVYSSKAR